MEQEDFKKLMKALAVLDKLSTPVLFKYANAVGLEQKDVDEMHNIFKELSIKYGN